MAADHFFAVKLGRAPAVAGGMIKMTNREVEFIIGKGFDVSGSLLDNHVVWALDTARCTQLVADVDAEGALNWESPSDSIEKLRTEFQVSSKRPRAACRPPSGRWTRQA